MNGVNIRVKTAAARCAAQVCLLAAAAALQAADTNNLLAPSQTNSWGWVTFWSGAKLENPSSIVKSGQTATLTTGPSTADGYIEINLNSRWVLRSGSFDQVVTGWTPPSPPPPPGSIRLVRFWDQMPDIDAQIGYIFRGAGSPTNFSAATIVGSADIYSDVSLGLPVLRYESAGAPLPTVKEQVTIEISGGFATDRQFLALHPDLFLGAGWQGRFPSPNMTGSPLPALFTGRIGLARIDEPHILTGATVALDSLGQPAFDPVWSPSLGFEIVYPLTGAINLQAGGNAYFNTVPASWNLNLGLTLDLGKFFASIAK